MKLDFIYLLYGTVNWGFGVLGFWGFGVSFLFNGLGLILLPLAQDVPQACGALAIRGVGSGMFWLTIHTYELMETSDHERDIYSTALSAGDQIITSASPRLCDTSDLDLA